MSGPVRLYSCFLKSRSVSVKLGRTSIRAIASTAKHAQEEYTPRNIDTHPEPASARQRDATTELSESIDYKAKFRKVRRPYAEPFNDESFRDDGPTGPRSQRGVTSRSPQANAKLYSKARAYSKSRLVGINIEGKPEEFSPLLLRDMCECESCVDASTKQKLFSTAEIPAQIEAHAAVQTENGVSILWNHDLPGYGPDHTTQLSTDVLRGLVEKGRAPSDVQSWAPGSQIAWDAQAYSQLPDVDYEPYMEDDAVLYQALQQLHTHGLVFLRNVPDSEKSVSAIAERIGPVKNTFYGYTWDVRSVPKAKNVAYTSQDLGFHMDLLYMTQPPHLQFLHCIRSSSAGGASLFADSYKAAADMFRSDFSAFCTLSNAEVNFHYNHPSSHLYHQSRRVFELKPLQWEGLSFSSIASYKEWHETGAAISPGMAKYQQVAPRKPVNILDHLSAVSWSPPFQAPFSLRSASSSTGARARNSGDTNTPLYYLNRKLEGWGPAASKFNAKIHRPDGIYERMMRPGECVLFDNRRVLHARKAFEVGDMGKERWLRGAYLDKDPYESKMRVLSKRFEDGSANLENTKGYVEAGRGYFEEAARA